MLVTYTNRKNVTYKLYRGTTKTGKPRYFFAKESAKGTPCETVPHGYEISESPNGIVSLVKSRPKLIRKDEVDIVQKLIERSACVTLGALRTGSMSARSTDWKYWQKT